MRIQSYYLVSVLLALLTQLCHCELYTAIVHLKRTLYAERNIARELRKHIQKEEEKLAILKSVANNYERHSKITLRNPGVYLGNPVNAFLLIKKFTFGWNKTFHLLKINMMEDMVMKLKVYTKEMPDFEDFIGAAKALYRLQDTYKLKTSEIGRGNMTAEDCFDAGKVAYTLADFYHAVLWMQESLTRWENEKTKTVSKEVVLDYLVISTFKQGNIGHALMLTDKLLALNPKHPGARNNKMYFERAMAEEMENSEGQSVYRESPFRNPRKVMSYVPEKVFLMYESLCRGENLTNLKDAHKLKCHYADHGNPFLKLAPVKEEEIHLKPWIVMYHNVISDREIALVKKLSTHQLKRATFPLASGEMVDTDYRISKSAWLQTHNTAIAKIDSRIETITGLDMTTAEYLQVANYGIGGYYEPHFDFSGDDTVSTDKTIFGDQGNRIATFMFYMSDVEAGGATVFIAIKKGILPKKGSAVFWYNFHKNGKRDWKTLHGACPVLLGTKWVMNKWIHERGQEFRWPCSLNKSE